MLKLWSNKLHEGEREGFRSKTNEENRERKSIEREESEMSSRERGRRPNRVSPMSRETKEKKNREEGKSHAREMIEKGEVEWTREELREGENRRHNMQERNRHAGRWSWLVEQAAARKGNASSIVKMERDQRRAREQGFDGEDEVGCSGF